MRYLLSAVLCIALMTSGCDEPISQMMMQEPVESRPVVTLENTRAMGEVLLLIPSDEFPLSQEQTDAHLETIDSVIKNAQAFFASEMQRLGHGPKTFKMLEEATGRVSVEIHRLEHPRATYETEGFFASLRSETANIKHWSEEADLMIFFADLNMLAGGRGRRSGVGGRVHLFRGGWNSRVLAHEMGHASGLEHDNRGELYRYLMSIASKSEMSEGAGEWLSRHRIFNDTSSGYVYGTNLNDFTASIVDKDAGIYEVRYHVNSKPTQFDAVDAVAVLLDDTWGRWNSVISFSTNIRKRYQEGVVVGHGGWEHPASIVHTIDFDGDIPDDVENVTSRIMWKSGMLTQILDSLPTRDAE